MSEADVDTVVTAVAGLLEGQPPDNTQGGRVAAVS